MIRSINIQYKSRQDLLAVQSQVAGCEPDHVLVQVFSGKMDDGFIDRLLAELVDVFPGVPIIGTTTAGEIMDGKEFEGTVLINVSMFESSRVKSVLVDHEEDMARTGVSIGLALRQPDVKAAIIFGCGLLDGKTINSEPVLRSISETLGDVILAGGQAADNGQGETTLVFTEAGVSECGVAAVSIGGQELHADNTYNLSWVPIGKYLTITEADGNRVFGIDGRTPYDLYVHYLGQEVADNLPLAAADFPFIVHRDGLDMAVHALEVHVDGSFSFIHDFQVGEQIRFGFCHAGLLALDAQVTHAEVAGFQPEALFVYSCVSRKWILGPDISVELRSLSDIAPCAGFFSYGEYYQHSMGKPFFFSQTMTVLSLTESRTGKPETPTASPGDFPVDESRQFRALRVLHRLVDKSTREIHVMNQELARLANMDSLTGIANRRLFDETLELEIRRLLRTGDLLSLVLMDVDYFKEYNDTYGHTAGDDCLRAASLLLKKHVRRPGDLVARYEGKTFACILPSSGHAGAMKVAEAIRTGFEDLAIPHVASGVSDHVSASFGVLTVEDLALATPAKMMAACDHMLQKAKQRGRNRVQGVSRFML